MQSKPFAFLAAGAIAALIVAGCSSNQGSSGQSTTTTTSTTSTSAPAESGASAAASPAASASAASTTTTSTTTTTNTNAATSTGDPAKGKTIFAANCASCHGATGTEGGVGPSLKNEKSRKNFQQAVAWIKNPQPPMPKLYPSPLSDDDVNNVAAYVETL